MKEKENVFEIFGYRGEEKRKRVNVFYTFILLNYKLIRI